MIDNIQNPSVQSKMAARSQMVGGVLDSSVIQGSVCRAVPNPFNITIRNFFHRCITCEMSSCQPSNVSYTVCARARDAIARVKKNIRGSQVYTRECGLRVEWSGVWCTGCAGEAALSDTAPRRGAAPRAWSFPLPPPPLTRCRRALGAAQGVLHLAQAIRAFPPHSGRAAASGKRPPSVRQGPTTDRLPPGSQ
jgi:hypothetical protein